MMKTKRIVNWILVMMLFAVTLAAQAAGTVPHVAAEDSVPTVWPAAEDVWQTVWEHPLSPWLRTADLVGLGLAGGWLFARLFFRSGRSHFTWSASAQHFLQLTVYGLSALLIIMAAAGQTVLLSTVVAPDSATGWRELLLATFSMAAGWATLIWLKPLLMLGLLFSSFSRHPLGILKSAFVSGVLVCIVLSGRYGYSTLFVSQLIHILASILWLGGALGFFIYSYILKDNETAYHFIFNKVYTFVTLSLAIMFMLAVSGVLLSISLLEAWYDVLRTDFGLKLLLKFLLFFILAGVMVWLRWEWLAGTAAQPAHQPRLFYTAVRRMFAIQAIVLCTGFILTGLMSGVAPPEQVDPHHARGEVQFHFTSAQSGQGEYNLVAYVMQDRQRVSGADVYFDLWKKTDDGHVRRLYDYICIDLELGLDAWRDELVRQGYLTSVKAEEKEEHVYIGSALLEAGSWYVRVHAQKMEEEIDAYQDYQLEVR
ncbi:putative membrane protein [Caldalkalibacillus uzonensis]|uniref:Membrane protein n=1 Tax=Caldalkalibacillus uzonensis TaxID=353224 RepID=A0ABU0CUA1_9BACI|nr:hypothetical protein [Caldalkalibacillus uzonensis]MDQ0339996.1 putative membrane protein [Caldalkalibacillus uzonensis]